MPKFTVLRRVDAFVDYVAEVEADDPKSATALASRAEQRFKWREESTHQFDARVFIALDVNGEEIPDTEIQDY